MSKRVSEITDPVELAIRRQSERLRKRRQRGSEQSRASSMTVDEMNSMIDQLCDSVKIERLDDCISKLIVVRKKLKELQNVV